MNKDGTETIKIRPELKDRLDQLGRRGESYSDIIARLLPLKKAQAIAGKKKEAVI